MIRFILVLLLPYSGGTFAQSTIENSVVNSTEDLVVRGIIKDEFGSPIPNTTVSIKDSDIHTLTDANGAFNILASNNNSLIISRPGFHTIVTSTNEELTNIQLTKTLLHNPHEVTLLHKSQNVQELLQATSTIYTEQLITTPAPSFLQALPGRLSGLYTRQRSGVQDTDSPVSVMDFRIRGQIPTILIDGVPRDFASIELESIASISILKDALSTVMYGQRSSNNIILVTTKRPEITPFKLSATVQHGSQSLINMPKVLPASEYAILYNEARMNDGLAPVYSAADILAYRNGSDSYGRPNVNWQEEVLNKNTGISRYNINMENGNDVARFYVALDYLKEGGFFKTSGLNSYNTNTQVDRYIVRSNVELDLNSSLKVGLNIFGRVQSSNQPGGTTSSTFTAISTTPQNAYPIFNADSSLGGNTNFTNNIYGLINNSGYRTYSSRDLSADIEVTQKLDKVTKGLWAKVNISYNNTTDQTVNRSKGFAVFNSLGSGSYQQIGQNQTMGSSFSFNARRTYTYGKLSFGYESSFSEDHKISGLLLADLQSTTFNLDLPASYNNYAANATYSYRNKYFAEMSTSYAGFNRYAPGKRYGFFYAAGIGWNVAKEAFLTEQEWISSLKPRITLGRTGNANVGYYVYEQYYDNGGTTYYFGASPTAAQGFYELPLANPNATWEKADKLNIGIDALLFNNRLSITSEYFNDTYHDLMQIRGRSSQLIGQSYPAENVGKNRYNGFENNISWSGKNQQLNYFISGNASFLKSNVIYQDEIFREYGYQRRTGLPVGQTFGYIAEGFYETQTEIDNAPRVEGYNAVLGDLKYRDLNDDGIINQFDEAPIGTQKPLIYYGLTTGFSIKGFDLSVSFQGIANRDIILSGSLEYEFENNGLGQAYQHHLYRWTPENAENATYPRLSIGNNINNQRNSTFWVRSADYLRIQNVDVGYTIPSAFTKRVKVNSIRIFANGFNLHSFDSLDHNDPENTSAAYPFLRKTINAGINIKL